MGYASDALAYARTLLNDDNATVWTDAALMPKLKLAHQELQTTLWEVGSPVVREESDLIDVPALQIDLGDLQPVDLLTPTKLYEYDLSGLFVGEMTEVFYFQKGVDLVNTMKYWAWRRERILFPGCILAIKVQLQYRRFITLPTENTSELGIAFAELYLGARVAALAGGSVGNKDVLDVATAMATANFGKVISANRGQQKPANRP